MNSRHLSGTICACCRLKMLFDIDRATKIWNKFFFYQNKEGNYKYNAQIRVQIHFNLYVLMVFCGVQADFLVRFVTSKITILICGIRTFDRYNLGYLRMTDYTRGQPTLSSITYLFMRSFVRDVLS